MVFTQAIKDARERERLLEEKEIILFADAKKVNLYVLWINITLIVIDNLENDEAEKRPRNGHI